MMEKLELEGLSHLRLCHQSPLTIIEPGSLSNSEVIVDFYGLVDKSTFSMYIVRPPGGSEAVRTDVVSPVRGPSDDLVDDVRDASLDNTCQGSNLLKSP